VVFGAHDSYPTNKPDNYPKGRILPRAVVQNHVCIVSRSDVKIQNITIHNLSSLSYKTVSNAQQVTNG